eukprot:1602117-Rhodomonas_salina.3
MSGTEIAYAGTYLHIRYAMSGTEIAYAGAPGERRAPARKGFGSHTGHALSPYGVAMRSYAATVLRTRYATSGTEIGYAATRKASCSYYGLQYKRKRYQLPMALRVYYAMSGTDRGYAAMHTELAAARREAQQGRAAILVAPYGRATRCPVLTYRRLLAAYSCAMRCAAVCGTEMASGGAEDGGGGERERGGGEREGGGARAAGKGRAYAMSGTDVAYAAMGCPGMPLCDLRYGHIVCPDEMSGTEIASQYSAILPCGHMCYAATPCLYWHRSKSFVLCESVLRSAMLLPGGSECIQRISLRYGAGPSYAISLRTRCALSGAKRAERGDAKGTTQPILLCCYCPTRVCCYCSIHTRYAISGTGIAYNATVLRARYAMSGTDVAYAATRSQRRLS